MKRKKKSGAPCMPYFGTVSSLLQSVDSHGVWGGLTDGLPSTLGSARSERDRTSLRCPPYAALTSVRIFGSVESRGMSHAEIPLRMIAFETTPACTLLTS